MKNHSDGTTERTQNFLFSPGPLSLTDTPTIHTVVFSYSLLLIEGTKEKTHNKQQWRGMWADEQVKEIGQSRKTNMQVLSIVPWFF